jgi:hypothetical protein
VACHIVKKYFNEGYNFALDPTSIKGLHKKLWASKATRVPILGISGVPTWKSQDFQIVLQPLVKLGYLETKYHGLLLLNYDTQPSLHTQCHCGA